MKPKLLSLFLKEHLDDNTDDAETETIQYERRIFCGRKSLPAAFPRVRIEYNHLMPKKSVNRLYVTPY
jgi:hypothetical protein